MNTASPEEVGFSSERLERINQKMQSYIDSGKLAGTSTMLSRDGKVFHFEQLGVQNLDTKQPMGPDTLFRIYSMTKPITSTAVMMMYEEGHFHLDDPVSKFLPQLADLKVNTGMAQSGPQYTQQDRPITIRHLLTHTAGLSYGNHQDSPVEADYREAKVTDPDSTISEMIDKLGEMPLVNQPGTKWRYSVATDVLGRLVEVISGQSFDDFLKERIFGPVGMTDTGFYVQEENLDRLATVYGPSDGGSIQPLENSSTMAATRPHTFLSGGGGLVATASDYMRFCNMLLDGGAANGNQIIGPKTVDMMTRNHLSEDLKPFAVGQANEADTRGCGFGLGFRVVTDLAQHGVIGSEGIYSWGGAASTVFWNDPKENISAILLTQFMPSSYYPLRREFQVGTYQAMTG